VHGSRREARSVFFCAALGGKVKSKLSRQGRQERQEEQDDNWIKKQKQRQKQEQ
jgi:hypothetical protein